MPIKMTRRPQTVVSFTGTRLGWWPPRAWSTRGEGTAPRSLGPRPVVRAPRGVGQRLAPRTMPGFLFAPFAEQRVLPMKRLKWGAKSQGAAGPKTRV